MMVYMWLSSSSKTDKVLVYAMLDTQSDAIFIVKETCDEPTKVRLSTITIQESIVNGQKISISTPRFKH